ncbi:MAG: hypothetical protein EOP83_33105 [Verrucomicrobiaceae bacterium]|nr:MAG: hypothetical protein EOP83_33105 [Verrucomicrobiaceae bacterium]
MAQLLDAKCYVAAIVLAGAAEDILQGALGKRGKASAASRSVLAKATSAMHILLEPQEVQPPKDSDAVDVMRSTYNWLRHNDRPDDVDSLRLNWRHEALVIAARAVDNLYELTGDVHPRREELHYPLAARSR